VAEDEVLYEVSTDKVDTEVASPASGFLAEIVVAEGDTVDVGAKLAVITTEAPGGGGGATPAAEPAPDDEPPAEESAAEEETPDAEAEAEPQPTPAPKPEPAAEAPEPEAPEPVERTPAPAPTPSTASVPTSPIGGGKLLSPVVRRLVAEHGLDPEAITGSGAGGRITREDVLKVIESGPVEAPTAPAAAPTAPTRAVPAPMAATPGERDTAVPHSNIRKRTAEHMTRSLATSAHVYVSIEVDFEAVERVRRAAKDEWKAAEGFSLTYLPFIARAVVDAVADFPEVNATFGADELIVHHYLNLGVAVDLDYKGLMVPVVHDADGKRLRAIAREISELAGKARTKKLGPDDISGGTFTITNPGPFGTTMTMPIINQPQVAILSTDGVKRRPVVVTGADGSEAIAIHSVGNLTLTWDHRAFDGAYSSGFLSRVRELLETRDWAAEL
ncbi:MAG: 2-oxo acid dehydrogenase subunit E2, partial [Acidimicrobiia bacterium]|nr:2-oxo acid dehydrogenase subunit E2 [Acidimicrobiia bacterium]